MKKLFLLLALVALSCAGSASAQSVPNFGSMGVPNGVSSLWSNISAFQKTAPRGYIHTWYPGVNGVGAGAAGTYSNASAGHVGIAAVEAPDDFYAVRLVAFNAQSSAWTITQAVAMPSASWGPTAVPGSTAYDPTGTAFALALPFTFGNNGANGSPYGASQGPLNGATRGQIIPLVLQSSADNSHLTFSSISPNTYFINGYSTAILSGWYVADGLGCVTPGTTVNSAAASMTLTGNLASTACQAGQTIYFSPVPFAAKDGTNFAWGTTVAASPSSTLGQISFSISDWLPINSLPRNDGGYAAGGTVTGTNVSGTLVGTTYNSLVLSAGSVTGSVAAQATLSVAYTATTTQTNVDTIANSGTLNYKLYVNTISGLKRGQVVTDANSSCPANTLVTEVGSDNVGNYVRISTACPAASGDVLTFTQKAYTTASASTGATSISVLSTSNNPILEIRYFIGSSTGPQIWNNNGVGNTCNLFQCEQIYGLPLALASYGGQNAGTAWDGVNFISTVGNGSGSPAVRSVAPTIGIQFLSRRRGLVTLQCGGYQASGAYTGSTNANALRRATAQLGAANGIPASSVNGGSTNQTGVGAEYCRQLIQLTQPDVVALWGFSDRGQDSAASFEANVKSLEEEAFAQGSRVILETDAPEASTKIGALVSGAATSASTTLPLASSPYYQGSGYLITGPGITAGTTVTLNGSTPPYSATLSQAATIPAGSTLYLDYQSGASSSGTTVTLAYPAFDTATYRITGTGVSSATTIATTKNSTTATLNQAATLTNGEALTLYLIDPSTQVITGITTGDYLSLQGSASSVPVVDMTSTQYAYDPNHPLFKCPSCTTQGSYNNDYAEGLWANLLQGFLQQMVGN